MITAISKKILVTGAAGFIGSHLVEKLLSEGREVIGIDNFDAFYERAIKESNLVTALKSDLYQFVEGDITDPLTFEGLPDDISAVVHLAAKAGVLPSVKDPLSYIHTNIVGTQQVLEFMKTRGISKLVFGSSSSVYGNTKTIPFREDQPVDFPISPYAQTKKSCELLNHTYHHLHQLDIVNLRFFTVYGPRQRPDLAIHKFTHLIMNDQPIMMYGDGSTARDYTYIEDIVAGIVAALHYVVRTEGLFDTFNIGNKSPVKLRELIDLLYQCTGKEPNITQVDKMPGDVDITYADISHAEKLLDYSPKISINQGIEWFVQWYKQH